MPGALAGSPTVFDRARHEEDYLRTTRDRAETGRGGGELPENFTCIEK